MTLIEYQNAAARTLKAGGDPSLKLAVLADRAEAFARAVRDAVMAIDIGVKP
jgi:hypothetical protein